MYICIYIRKRLYCPCSPTENKFNVYLKIDSDNGLGVPPRTNKTNRAWRSARVQRSLLFTYSSEKFYQLRGTPRNFVNDQNNVLREFPRKAWIFLGVLRRVGNPRGVYCNENTRQLLGLSRDWNHTHDKTRQTVIHCPMKWEYKSTDDRLLKTAFKREWTETFWKLF